MNARLTLFLALLLLCTGAALAQTPDPCGDETGAAYGLCNAYVAAECQTDTPSASDVACSRIAGKFLQITGRHLEAKFATCPCVDIAGFSAILANATFCDGNFDSGYLFLFPDSLGGHPFAVTISSRLSCSYGESPGVEITLPLTSAQAAACLDAMQAVVVARGLTCIES